MSKLGAKLPITLVLIDGTSPELARLALEDTLAQIEVDELLICSPVPIDVWNDFWVKTPAWQSRQEVERFVWYDLPYRVHTEHVLMISWDAWVLDGSMWTDEFLDYDYVGAPWWYSDGLNVGHGVLRSRKLLRFLAEHEDRFEHRSPEDDTLSRTYRHRLERLGFRWPSEQLASRFMFETTRPHPRSRHFMFHASSNFHCVLPPDRLAQRLALMREVPYLADNLENMHCIRPWILPRLCSAASSSET